MDTSLASNGWPAGSRKDYCCVLKNGASLFLERFSIFALYVKKVKYNFNASNYTYTRTEKASFNNMPNCFGIFFQLACAVYTF